MQKPLKIIGISVRTQNLNSMAIQDISALWDRFFQENIMEKTPQVESHNIYAIYTDYESDFTGKYTTIIGMEVLSLENIPEGLIGRTFPAQNFKHFIAKGPVMTSVAKTWQDIWHSNTILNRTYLYDYELYGEKSQKGDESEVEIFIGIN